jgi:hypothetical protein
MQTYADNVVAGGDAVVRSSPPLEQLDGLMWVNVNVLDRFSEEFKIQLAWLRLSPPGDIELGLSFGQQLECRWRGRPLDPPGAAVAAVSGSLKENGGMAAIFLQKNGRHRPSWPGCRHYPVVSAPFRSLTTE